MFHKSSAISVVVLLMVVLLAAGAFATAETPAKPDDPQAKTAGDTLQVIPTLTEWGMIIFSVLLFGCMAWMVVRRKRATEVGM